MKVFTADGTLANLSATSFAGLVAADQLVLGETVSFVTVSVTVHPKLFAETCQTPPKTFSSDMFELTRDPLINANAPSLETLLHPTAIVAEWQATSGQLQLVRFNGGSNTIPFTSHSCEYLFYVIRHGMLFDILEEQLCIEFMGKVAKKDLSEWLFDCRQVHKGIK
jgi:hypothetical protein